MAGKTCWKCCCRILADDFTRADDTDPGDNWDETVSGAAISSNQLLMNSAGATVISTQESNGASFVVYTTLKISTANIHARVLIDWVDADNFHFLDVHFRHTGATTTIQLYKRESGSNTAIGDPQTTNLYAVDDTLLLVVCLDTDGRLIGSLTLGSFTNIYLSCLAETTALGGTKIGLQLVDAGTIYWDALEWQKHKTESDSCPNCFPGCNVCTAGTGSELILTVEGIVDDSCSGCDELLNGTFVIPALCPCEWLLQIGEQDECGNTSGFEQLCSDSASTATGVSPPMWLIQVLDLGGAIEIYVQYMRADGTVSHTWWKSIDPFDGDCDWDFDLDYLSGVGDGRCDVTGATLHLEVAA